MRKEINPNHPIFIFFSEYFKMIKKYYVVENTEEYWDGIVCDINTLYSRYAKAEFSTFVKALIMAFVVWKEKELKDLK